MRKARAILLVALMAAMTLLPSLAQAADGTVTVQTGDTLTSIAARYGTSVDQLVALNGLASANLIFVGQSLRVPNAAPAPAPAAPAASGGGSYTVQPGDFLSVIAERNGVSQDALMAANGINNPNLIFAGQTLTIPGANKPALLPRRPSRARPCRPAPQTGGGGTYTVKPGDSLSDIAAANGTTVDALLQRNNIADPNVLYSGQVINLPGSNAPAAPQEKPAEQPKPAAPAAEPTQGPKVTAPNSSEPVITPKPGPPPPAPESANVTTPKDGETVKYTVQSGDRLYSIAAKYNTTVDAIIARNSLNDPNMIYSGQVLTIQVGDKTSKPVASNAEVPAAAPNKAVPPKKSNNGKWIDVNISTQRITAYEGDTPVFTSLVSTGVAPTRPWSARSRSMSSTWRTT